MDDSIKLKEYLRGLEATLSRTDLARGLGKTYDGERDVYEACGYKKTLVFSDYWQYYKRDPIGRTVITRAPSATWTGDVSLRAAEKEGDTNAKTTNTRLQNELNDLTKRLKLLKYCNRVDKLARIGNFAVLVIGFSDGGELSDPVSLKSESSQEGAGTASAVMYFSVYTQGSTKVLRKVTDTKSSRYGLPEMYSITMDSQTRDVHWTRVIHVAEAPDEDDLMGTPALEACVNNLDNLTKISGGTAEGAWRQAFSGLAAEADPDMDVDEEELDKIKTQMDEVVHNLRRTLIIQGAKVKEMKGSYSDPSPAADVEFSMVASHSRIPKRVLTGSERGELASSQDERAWVQFIIQRREEYAEPDILLPVLERLYDASVLSSLEIDIDWPESSLLNEKQEAEVKKILVAMMKEYVSGGLDVLVPPEIFLKQFLGLSDDMADLILSQIDVDELGAEEEEPEEEPEPDPDPSPEG